jgi:ubiquinone/menaquinone biosynthesis C-methylase UbiE
MFERPPMPQEKPSQPEEKPRRKGLKETLMREVSIGPIDAALEKRAQWMVKAAGIQEALAPKIAYRGEPRFGQVERGVSVLCVGAGKGHEMDEIDAMLPGSEVVGVDPHDYQTRPVEKRLKTLAHDARYLPETSSAENLQDVADASMDGAALFFVLHNIDASRHEGVMKELARVLKPDGRLFVAEDLVEDEAERKNAEKIDRRLNLDYVKGAPKAFKSEAEWSEFFRAHGFEFETSHEEKSDKVRHGFFVLKKVGQESAA